MYTQILFDGVAVTVLIHVPSTPILVKPNKKIKGKKIY